MHLCVAKQGQNRAETVDMQEGKLALAAQYCEAAMAYGLCYSLAAELKVLKKITIN